MKDRDKILKVINIIVNHGVYGAYGHFHIPNFYLTELLQLFNIDEKTFNEIHGSDLDLNLAGMIKEFSDVFLLYGISYNGSLEVARPLYNNNYIFYGDIKKTY